MKSSTKKLLSLAFGISALASTSVFAGNCGTGGHGDYYRFETVGNAKITMNLQGFGKVAIPNKLISTAKQSMEMTSDCKFVSKISLDLSGTGLGSPGTLTDIFVLNGSWAYPAESNVIYFTIDGEVSAGSASTGTWGALFDPEAVTGIPSFVPILYTKFDKAGNPIPTIKTPIAPIHQTFLQKTGTVKIDKTGKTAALTTLITGKTVAQSFKTNISKEAIFSFGATAKAEVFTVPKD